MTLVEALERIAANGCCFEDTYGSCAEARAHEDGEADDVDCDGCIARAALAAHRARPPLRENRELVDIVLRWERFRAANAIDSSVGDLLDAMDRALTGTTGREKPPG